MNFLFQKGMVQNMEGCLVILNIYKEYMFIINSDDCVLGKVIGYDLFKKGQSREGCM